jgi:hypothetical protein
MYDNVVTSVRTSDRDTNDFPINIRLHQGSALSPYLFALVMDEVTRDIQGGIPWCMCRKMEWGKGHTGNSLGRQLILRAEAQL